MRVDQELATYLQVLWRQKWMIVACASCAMLVALGISVQLTPVYSAIATLRAASAPGGVTDYSTGYSMVRLINTYVEIATSDSSLDDVVEQLGLQEPPDVQVDGIPETELIEITASDSDPARAQAVANSLAALMVERSVQLYGGNALTAREILEQQIAQAEDDLNTALSEYDAAARVASSLSVSASQDMQSADAELEMLDHLVNVRQQIYGDLLRRYEDARINEQVRANTITVVQFADLPEEPSSPNAPLNTALGLVAGLATGLILAFVLEGMDQTIRSVDDVQAMTTAPVLCQVPSGKRALARPIGSTPSKADQRLLKSAFQQLRLRLLLAHSEPAPTMFLITSPEPGAGKSTVAANLALSIAEAGHRVLLVDMDIYHPRLQSIFNLSDGRGLSDVISGHMPLEDFLQETAQPLLRVVTAGANRAAISGGITPAQITALVDSLRKHGDYVLIDAPALLAAAESAVLASLADAVLLVVALRGTERKHLGFALQELAELNVRLTGIVVNKAQTYAWHRYYSNPQKELETSGTRDEVLTPKGGQRLELGT